jgi:hypothetical protein
MARHLHSLRLLPRCVGGVQCLQRHGLAPWRDGRRDCSVRHLCRGRVVPYLRGELRPQGATSKRLAMA